MDRDARELLGTVSGIVWTDCETNGDGDDGKLWVQIAKLTDKTTVKGSTPEPLETGLRYRFFGRWREHGRYGWQFDFSTCCVDTPLTERGIVKYLAAHAPGIGKVTARDLWNKYGPDAVRVVREEPQRAVADGILSRHCADEAAAELKKISLHESTKIDLWSIFDGRGFPGKLIAACMRKWGALAPQRVRRDPFTLMVHRLPGCGFVRCDKLYVDLGGRRDALKRQMLAGWHEVREVTSSTGDTWNPVEKIGKKIEERICGVGCVAEPARAMKLGIRAKWLAARRDPTNGTIWIAEHAAAQAETRLADHIRRKIKEFEDASEGASWPDVLHVLREAGDLGPDNTPTTHQEHAILSALSGPIGSLTGTPGTGKTFCAAAIIKALYRSRGGPDAIAVCAPTGKAAVRCTEAMQRYGLADVKATTIHRLLKVSRNGHDGGGWGFRHNETNPLPFAWIVCDESSMVDCPLAASLMAACGPGSRVLFVGDTAQLPPVGHGAPLRDMIRAGVPCGELTEIHRNAGQIVIACRDIKAGHQRIKVCGPDVPIDLDNGKNLKAIGTDSPPESIQAMLAVLRAAKTKYNRDPAWECQVLVAVNVSGPLSRRELNAVLQDELNPLGKRAPAASGNKYRIGDKIICLRNSMIQTVCEGGPGTDATNADDYERENADEAFLANGEIGKVVAVSEGATVARFLMPDRLMRIPTRKGRKQTAKDKDKEEQEKEGNANGNADADQAEESEAKGSTANDFDLAYAITTHKSQGSSWPIIVAMIDDNGGAYRVTSREWWYTAISRAEMLAVLIGRPEVMDRQRRREALPRRKTLLVEQIRGGGA